jgi:hypothetical protein
VLSDESWLMVSAWIEGIGGGLGFDFSYEELFILLLTEAYDTTCFSWLG